MMNKKQFGSTIAAAAGLVLLAPALAFAQTPGVSSTTTVTTTSTSVTTGGTVTPAMQKAIQRADQEIMRRINALHDLNTRVQSMQEVTDTFKQNLSSVVQSQITAFTSLQDKIDADTDLATLKTDVQSITQSYRVFALVLPQGRIAAAADRVVTIVTMMGTLGSKLQARVQAGGQAGNDTTAATAALTDMSSKLTDAQTQAQAAVTASTALTPDNGDATLMASNNKVLAQARADLKVATTDLQAARKDITTIVKALAKMTAAPAASSTTP